MSDLDQRHMPIAEFQQRGYLQEVNRRFFLPLGLALVVAREEDGTMRLACIWDYRDDPAGMILDEWDRTKAAYIDQEMEARKPARLAAVGFWIQE
jgi:hypothetical protein